MDSLDKEKHYTRGRDIEPISGMVVDVSYSLKYRNELARIAGKEYYLARFKELYNHLGLKEDEELEKIYEIEAQTKDKIIYYTRQGINLENISRLQKMPSYQQIKEIIASDPSFAKDYSLACQESSIFIVDEIESITKEFIDGNSAPHIDAVGLNSVVKSLATVARMKNPERFGENAKTTITNNFGNLQQNTFNGTSTEQKMIIEYSINQISDKKTLESIIMTAQKRLEDLINKELEILND